MVHDLGWRTFGDDLSAMYTGTWADIHDIVGHADGVLVVFDDDYRVADVTQMVKGAQKAVVVTLVQADGRLVEDVHHPD
ncbi:hypothetical protein D3C78_1574170 [compost metagenome]